MADVSQAGGTLLDKIVGFIIPPNAVHFLNTILYRNPIIFLNYWSFVHFFSGVIFYFLFPKKFKLWIYINILFEVIEFILALGGNPLFVEDFVDIFWDIILSLSGFLLTKQLVEKIKPKIYK